MKNKVVPFLDAPCIIRIFTFIYHQFKPTVLKYSIHSPHLWCLFSIGGSPSLGILAHLLRMVMEPKYCAFRRWLYTPIILWHGEPGSLGHIYIWYMYIIYSYTYIHLLAAFNKHLRAVISHVVMALVVRASTDPSGGITEENGKISPENHMDLSCALKQLTRLNRLEKKAFFWGDLYIYIYVFVFI